MRNCCATRVCYYVRCCPLLTTHPNHPSIHPATRIPFQPPQRVSQYKKKTFLLRYQYFISNCQVYIVCQNDLNDWCEYSLRVKSSINYYPAKRWRRQRVGKLMGNRKRGGRAELNCRKTVPLYRHFLRIIAPSCESFFPRGFCSSWIGIILFRPPNTFTTCRIGIGNLGNPDENKS